MLKIQIEPEERLLTRFGAYILDFPAIFATLLKLFKKIKNLFFSYQKTWNSILVYFWVPL